MLVTLLVFLLFVIIMLLVLAATSGNIFGRLLAVNVLGTVIATLIAIIGVMANQPDYFDIALLYILLNFSTTLALLRFFRKRDLPFGLLDNISNVPIAPETGGVTDHAAHHLDERKATPPPAKQRSHSNNT